MTTTPAASMVIPVFAITSLNTISPLLTWAGRPVRVEDRELLERARPEVAHIVDLVALKQRPDPIPVDRARWNME